MPVGHIARHRAGLPMFGRSRTTDLTGRITDTMCHIMVTTDHGVGPMLEPLGAGNARAVGRAKKILRPHISRRRGAKKIETI
jgi:hypothetical protein